MRQLSPADRLEYLLELGGGMCAWCGFDLAKPNARPTRELIVPKVKGGMPRLENEIATCSSCNQLRAGRQSPSQFIEMCRRERGLSPNVTLIAEQLDSLNAVIEREGGMHKIRDYVKREARRVRNLVEG